jgi:hypothetical protein
LAHVEKNEVRRAYARGEYWEERVKLADWWAIFDRAVCLAQRKEKAGSYLLKRVQSELLRW